jgi:L-alanine-DL-glutamate epimerase-like enolase superfamily enzyme
MKITQIETIPVEVPLKQGMTTKTAHGEHITSPYVILKVHTDEGVIGLGEATVAPRWSGETSRGCVAILEDLFEPALIGSDPTAISLACETMDEVIKLNPFAKSAVEMALWDILGKTKDKPLYDLLGGKVRESIPIKMVVGAFDVEDALRLARMFLDQGFRCLKVKVGLDVEGDVERVRAVRNLAGPEIHIGVDANCGWSVPDAIRALKEMSPLNVLFAEQPVGREDATQMAEVKQTTSIPVMADESVFTPAEALTVVRENAADVISLYPGKNGSILASRRIAQIAKASGIVCHMGSNLELGIATAAMAHLAVAEETIDSETYPADILGPLYHDSDLIEAPVSTGPDGACPPDGAGLGVSLDEDAVDNYRVG